MPVTPLHHLHDPAWINWSFHDYGFNPDGRSLWLLSEQSGFSHLYRIELGASDAANDNPGSLALTDGEYVVSEPQPSPDGRFLYFRANVEHPGQYEIYRVEADPGSNRASQPEPITDYGAMTSARLSPDGSRLVAMVSSATRPQELFVQPATPVSARNRRAKVEKRTDTTSDAFLRRSWAAPEFVEIPSSHVDGKVHARLYLPEDLEPNAPAVFFVHGAGYLQNAHKGWSSYFREFMFHSLLVERGYVVLDMDYRASAGYGRDWRTAIYRQMGTPELEDLRDGVDWLVAEHGIDRERIGVYGGSYGGFLTLMALFREPDLFAAGAALRPVTDWAHYNPPLHIEHSQHAGAGPRGLSQQLADRVCRGAREASSDVLPDARRQRSLPGQRTTDSAADRAREDRLVDCTVPGRASRLPGTVQLAG